MPIGPIVPCGGPPYKEPEPGRSLGVSPFVIGDLSTQLTTATSFNQEPTRRSLASTPNARPAYQEPFNAQSPVTMAENQAGTGDLTPNSSSPIAQSQQAQIAQSQLSHGQMEQTAAQAGLVREIKTIGDLLRGENIEPEDLLNTTEAYIRGGLDIGDAKLLLNKVKPMSEDQLHLLDRLGQIGVQAHRLNLRRSSATTVTRMEQPFKDLSEYANNELRKIVPAADETRSV